MAQPIKRLGKNSKLENFAKGDHVEITGVASSNQKENGRVVSKITMPVCEVNYATIVVAIKEEERIQIRTYFQSVTGVDEVTRRTYELGSQKYTQVVKRFWRELAA